MGTCFSSPHHDLENLSLDDCEDYWPDITKAKILRAIDGDTVVIGTPDRKKFTIRLYGINCEELKSKSKRAIDAKNFTAEFVGSIVTVQLIKKKESFGRLLATIHTNRGDLSQLLLNANLADEYKK
jgi:endonuclease YncB( thermonuclease family)